MRIVGFVPIIRYFSFGVVLITRNPVMVSHTVSGSTGTISPNGVGIAVGLKDICYSLRLCAPFKVGQFGAAGLVAALCIREALLFAFYVEFSQNNLGIGGKFLLAQFDDFLQVLAVVFQVVCGNLDSLGQCLAIRPGVMQICFSDCNCSILVSAASHGSIADELILFDQSALSFEDQIVFL